MIKLLHLLAESQTTPPEVVYHFTTPESFDKIWKSDRLKAHPAFNQISFTSDPELWAFQEHPDSTQEIGVRLAFESDSLPSLRPFTFPGAPGEDYSHEQEWITTSGDIQDIQDRLSGSATMEIAATEYYRDWLESHLPPRVFRAIEFV
jgi:hypothetical protein